MSKKLFSLFICTVFAILKHLEAFESSLFSLFCTDFAILKHLEAFGSSLFSLFCTVSLFWSIWKHLEAHCFRYFAPFSPFCTVSAIWKHLEAFGSLLLFSLFCTVLTLKRQLSVNSPASICFQNSPYYEYQVTLVAAAILEWSVALLHSSSSRGDRLLGGVNHW